MKEFELSLGNSLKLYDFIMNEFNFIFLVHNRTVLINVRRYAGTAASFLQPGLVQNIVSEAFLGKIMKL